MTVLMMNYTIAQTLSLEHFKRRFGVHRETFNQMVKALKPVWRPTLKPEQTKECLRIGYWCAWREYRTYFIGGSWR